MKKITDNETEDMGKDIIPYVFVISYNRPVYLWVCLDSIYKKTNMKCNIVLIDNNSEDDGVKKVISGFEKRNMFYDVHKMDSNLRDNFGTVFKKHYSHIGDYFFFIESDVQILTENWMSLMIQYYKSDEFAFLGSAVDQSDFIDANAVIAKEGGDVEKGAVIDNENIFLAKLDNSERQRDYSGTGIYKDESGKNRGKNHIPPARLSLWKTDLFYEHIDDMNYIYSDCRFGKYVIDKGYQVGIIKELKHRHLSLMNYYDYTDHNLEKRHNYFTY